MQLPNFRKLNITISGLLQFTLVFAILMQGYRNLRTSSFLLSEPPLFERFGTVVWLCIFAVTIGCAAKQIGCLIVGSDLPFDKQRIGLRIQWTFVRLAGVISLAYHLVLPAEWRLDDGLVISDATDVTTIISTSIIANLVRSFGAIGLLLCMMPLYASRTVRNSSRWKLLASSTLSLIAAIAVLLWMAVDSQTFRSLLYFATTGIEFGMQRPVAWPEIDMVENLNENCQHYARKAVLIGVVAMSLSFALGSWLMIRPRNAKRIFAGGWLLLLPWLIVLLIAVNQNELPSLNDTMSVMMLAWPQLLPMLAAIGLCLFVGFLITCRTNASNEPLVLDKSKLPAFQLPNVILTVMVVGALFESYLIANYTFEWFLDSGDKFLEDYLAPSTMSICTLGFRDSGANFFNWTVIFSLVSVQGLLNRYRYFDD